MNKTDFMIQTQLQRLQRFLNHHGFTVEMQILNEFYVQSQEKIEKKPKGQSPIKTSTQPVVCVNDYF